MHTNNSENKVKKRSSLWKNKYKKKKDIIELFLNENLINKNSIIAQTNTNHLFPLLKKNDEVSLNKSNKVNLPNSLTTTSLSNPLPISPDNSDNEGITF